MKTHKSSSLLGILILTLLLLCGCAMSVSREPAAAKQDRIIPEAQAAVTAAPETTAPIAETEPIPETTPAAQASVPEQTAPATVSASASSPLMAEEAEAIALAHAGFTSDQVTRLHTEFDRDRHADHYDVEFDVGRLEYEYEIHAETGKILSFEKDD